jgi:hypothetical protein
MAAWAGTKGKTIGFPTLFTWTTTAGDTLHGYTLPEDTTNIVELILTKNGTIRAHESHDVHENALRAIPPNLRILRATDTRVRTFPTPIPNTLEEIYMERCMLLTLPPLGHATGLIVLEFPDNSIYEITNPLPPNLCRLNLSSNALTAFTSVIPASLTYIDTNRNPRRAGVVLPNQRHVVLRPHLQPLPAVPEGYNVYTNSQNVHASGIQNSVKKAIQYIVNYKPTIPNDPGVWHQINKTLYTLTWLQRICHNKDNAAGSILETFSLNPYSMYGVTFATLVNKVWARIMDAAPNVKTELLKRFEEEVLDGKDKCTNGMMVRLVNIFIGFDDNIQMVLNDKEILQSRIPATLKRALHELHLTEGNETLEYWIKVYKETIQDLKELEVGVRNITSYNGSPPTKSTDYEEWQPWLEDFSETILDLIVKDVDITKEMLRNTTTSGITDAEICLKNYGLTYFEWEKQWLQNHVEEKTNYAGAESP